MDPAEVLALELQQFRGDDLQTIVPVVYGQTEEARGRKKSSSIGREWNKEIFFAECADRNPPDAVHVAEVIARWMEENGDQVVFGRGTKDGSMTMTVTNDGIRTYPLSIWTYGRIEIEFQYLMKSSFKDEEKRIVLLSKLNAIDGINFARDVITRRPTLRLTTLARENRLEQFLSVMRWLVDELKERKTNLAGTSLHPTR